MNLLIDFIPFQTQGGYGGAASFAKAVYDELFATRNTGMQVMAAYDATLPTEGRFDCHQLASQWGIPLVDISTKPLAEVISSHAVDTFFIAIGQFYAPYDLRDIKCKVIMFIHDIFDVERCDNRIDLMLSDKFNESSLQYAKRLFNLWSGRWQRQQRKRYEQVIQLFSAANTIPYTVSEYSRSALEYYFPQCANKIRICYSPLKNQEKPAPIEHPKLAQLVQSGKPYLLMLAANRIYKNPSTVVKVFRKLQEEHPDLHLLTLKYGKSTSPRHIDIDYLSDADLEHAYKHAYALVFGSFFEGFGYPPIEAARHGTPTVASNVTSIPEILGDAGIYFSPFYPADLYRALKLVLADRDTYAMKSSQRYEQICKRQKSDLNTLINEIGNKTTLPAL